MKNLIDTTVAYITCVGVLLTPVFTYGIVNTLTRPDFSTVALTIPARKPVTAIYEFGPDDEFPAAYDTHAWNDDYEPYVETFEEDNAYSQADVMCMAKNIYFEAKNQSRRGQLAVGLVTLNRVESPYYPNNVCEVIYQAHQFSWYWDGLPDRPKNQKAFERAMLLATALLDNDGRIVDFTEGSDHYHADYVEPSWRFMMVKITQIGAHIFYRNY